MTTSNKATKIKFLQFHQPSLTDGDYKVDITQKLTADGVGDKDSFSTSMKFSVLGDRYSLKPNLISGVFPQAGGLGAYSNVLPHIILNRSTLPWERYAVEGKKGIPWLALLVFDEDELACNTPKDKLSKYGIPKDQYANYAKTGLASIQYKDYKNGNSGDVNWPKAAIESGSHDQDHLQVLDVNTATLRKVMANGQDLSYLTHVRQAETEEDKLIGKEKAVLIANRLPKAGSSTVVHLVSIEDRMQSGGFDYRSATPKQNTRLISLHHWKFSCIKKNQTFSGLLLHLNQEGLFNIPFSKPIAKSLNTKQFPDAIKQGFANAGYPLSTSAKVTATGYWDVFDRDYHYIVDSNRNVYDGSGVKLFTLENQRLTNGKFPSTMVAKFKKHGRPLLKNAKAAKQTSSYWWITDGDHSYFINTDQGQMHVIRLHTDKNPTLRLPDTDNKKANQLLKNGFVPLPHQLRKGGRTVSWYRSPLGTTITKPAKDIDPKAFPVNSSDELLRYDKKIGMLDVSYASAWELGRLMMLKNKGASVALWQWKRHHKQLVDQTRQREQAPHIPMAGVNTSPAEFPKQVEKYLSNLSLLKGIPFNYLVPEERQLPKESIRYFNINPDWIASLIDGAFSIGRITKNDQDRDKNHRKYLETLSPYSGQYSGFIMRSTVVKGWPGLEVDGFDLPLTKAQKSEAITSPPLEILRMDRLGSDTLLVIFKGELKVLDIHLKPEMLHFGLDLDPEIEGQYTKTFRDHTGNQDDAAFLSKVTLDANRKVDIKTLYDSANGFSTTPLGFTDFSSAQFALCMIEGVQKVRFLCGS